MEADKPIPWSKTHEALKTHLETKQCAPNTPAPESLTTLRDRAPLRPQRADEVKFTMEELEGALGKLKRNKAPGPDKVSNELLLMMDPQTKTLLLGYYNQIWEYGEATETWKEAVVVSIYKGKGADTDPANYRPISLLNAIYTDAALLAQGTPTNTCSVARPTHRRRVANGLDHNAAPKHPARLGSPSGFVWYETQQVQNRSLNGF